MLKSQNCPVFPEDGPENQEGPVFPEEGPENREGPVFLEDGPENREGPVFPEDGPENREGPVFPKDGPENREGPVFPEDGPENREGPGSSKKASAAEKKEALQSLLEKLKLKESREQKLRLKDILQIKSENTKTWTPETIGDLPGHFLKKIMALNGTARSTKLMHKAHDDQANGEVEEQQDMGENTFSLSDPDSADSLHPLDVLCAVLLCSDSFLQQEILSKMSMCQFALPLLLPPLDSPKCTLLLWAMRDIVKRWRPHSLAQSRGFREESLVLTQMPTISFVRLGSCSFSKSQLLNEVLSPAQQHHDFFVHRDMKSGKVPREIADGLVEIVWYFPSGRENSDLFPEPIAVTNLRGDIESHELQFKFLVQVSSAVFIFVESLSERQYKILSSLQKSSIKCYFIFNTETEKANETLGFLNKLAPKLKLNKSNLLKRHSNINREDFVDMLQKTIQSIIRSPLKTISVEEMASTADKLEVQTDEDFKQCQNAKMCAKEIIDEIPLNNIAEYKKNMLRLQGDPWKELATVEKELCRMKKQGKTPSELYKSNLKHKLSQLRTKQNEFEPTNVMEKFIKALAKLSGVEKCYFLKWLKFRLDHITRHNLSELRNQYKQKRDSLHESEQKEMLHLAQLDELISVSSLGLEHFMRELGQFYEAEKYMSKQNTMKNSPRKYIDLPGIMAELMLEGFPMELIDGDASNIPLQWVTDVLTELHAKLRGRSRMLVLTVLGVQGTGKSTLLNTMFGLQLAVSSGRCTRGAFMTLIQVAETFQQDLGCDFLLVIDTEGLKAPELAMLEDSYQHDNELATLVVGLSDVTIVNMAMENATEMKDVLQIAVHAFLRMKEIGQKHNCQFVHQNVSDVSAHEQNMRDRKRLLQQLDEMTKAAARMENKREVKFSDIMEYDPEKHNWYISGLWHGVPPMASVNVGYSESVCELKKHLFNNCSFSTIPKDTAVIKPKNITEFIKWVESLWSAVKHENFIFSFRNSLVADAYNELSLKYSKWIWDFHKDMHRWVAEKETFIQNNPSGRLDIRSLQNEILQEVRPRKENILRCLQQHFDGRAQNAHLIEKYREDFMRSAEVLSDELQRSSIKKCEEAIRIQKDRHKINAIQNKYRETIERKVDELLAECRRKEHTLKDGELNSEFEKTWEKTLSELSIFPLETRQVYHDMDQHFKNDLVNKGPSFNENVQKAGSLLNCKNTDFVMKDEYLVTEKFLKVFWPKKKTERKTILKNAYEPLIILCKDYTDKTVNSKVDYDETYCRELLHMINERLQKEDIKEIDTSPCFEVDLKFHILGKTAHAFQNMHENFITENDPLQLLQRLKPQYLATFTNLYLEKDICQEKAKDFCYQCLKPALVGYVNRELPGSIVRTIQESKETSEYGSRSIFQFTVLKKLLEQMNFENYVKFISNYEEFVKNWIESEILAYCRRTDGLRDLEKDILSTIIKKVKSALESSRDKNAPTVYEFINHFCELLQHDLVISRSMEEIWFKGTAKADQFYGFMKSFLPGLEQSISSELKDLEIEYKLSRLHPKPLDEIFNQLGVCGKQCPFCKVPCEAQTVDHKEHFATAHRPQGLGRYRWLVSSKLCYALCSSDVVSNCTFRNPDTDWKDHPYKDYRKYYPDWHIHPDPNSEASDYWKFVFSKFNEQFAEKYKAVKADLPEDWGNITDEQAMESLKRVFNIK